MYDPIGRFARPYRGSSVSTGEVSKRFPLPKGATPPKQIEAPAPTPEEKRDRLLALLESDRLDFLEIRDRFERTGRRDPELRDQQAAIEDELVDHVRELQALGPIETPSATPEAKPEEFVAFQTSQGVNFGYLLPSFDGLSHAA